MNHTSRVVPGGPALALPVVIGFFAIAALAAGPHRSDTSDGSASYRTAATVAAAAEKRGAAAGWHGGVTIASTGESVTVYVSDDYSGEPNTPQRWADVFAHLVHGSELASVTVYVAPLVAVQGMCGDDALACYSPGRITIPGDTIESVSPESVAAHEYGHHIALNRLNPPWAAIAWGTKRWATGVGICPRVGVNQAFPGNEGWGYRLNPGEGFVEAYRVLNELADGAATFEWTLVDNSFYPSTAALEDVRQDVVDPWLAPTRTTLRAVFAERGRRSWSRTIALPLDGDLRINARMPVASGYNVLLRSRDGSRVLARSRWTSGAVSRTLVYTVCGVRSGRLELVRTGAPGTVTMRVETP